MLGLRRCKRLHAVRHACWACCACCASARPQRGAAHLRRSMMVVRPEGARSIRSGPTCVFRPALADPQIATEDRQGQREHQRVRHGQGLTRHADARQQQGQGQHEE